MKCDIFLTWLLSFSNPSFPTPSPPAPAAFTWKRNNGHHWSSTMHIWSQSMRDLLRLSLRLCIDETQFKDCLTIPSITVSIGPSIFPKDDPRDLKVMVWSSTFLSSLLLTSWSRQSSPRFPSRRPPSLPLQLASQRAFVEPGPGINGCCTQVNQICQNQMRWMGGGTYWLLYRSE